MSIEYTLFRVKFIKPKQTSLLNENLSPSEFLLKSLEEKPSTKIRNGFEWHIGNFENFEENTQGYFAVGRTTISSTPQFDNHNKNFLEKEIEESPYTHCVFDSTIGIIGIAKQTNLASSSLDISRRLRYLISCTEIIKRNNISVEILPIPDPDEFVKKINLAFRVYNFSATFRCPNPFDADEYFQKPLSVYLKSANGISGIAKIKGDDLERDVITEVTRSSAATGNEASARIKPTEKEKAITIKLSGDFVKIAYDEDKHNPRQVIKDLIQEYHRIRQYERN